MEAPRDLVEKILRQAVAQAEVELYHWELTRAGPKVRLLVYIDRPDGVSVEDCARASRIIGNLLDASDPFPSSYVLEVSSPGLDRRLWEPRHYPWALGKKVHLRVRDMERPSYQGRLMRADDRVAVLEVGGAMVEIPLSQVTYARVVYEEGKQSQ